MFQCASQQGPSHLNALMSMSGGREGSARSGSVPVSFREAKQHLDFIYYMKTTIYSLIRTRVLFLSAFSSAISSSFSRSCSRQRFTSFVSAANSYRDEQTQGWMRLAVCGRTGQEVALLTALLHGTPPADHFCGGFTSKLRCVLLNF